MNLMTWRYDALRSIIKAYKPTVSAQFVISELGFSKPGRGLKFLECSGVHFIETQDDASSSSTISSDDNIPSTTSKRISRLMVDCKSSAIIEIDAGNDLM